MGCNSDYLNPNELEAYSKKTAILLVYVYNKMGAKVPEWMQEAANNVYGNPQKHNDLTEILCAFCSKMSEEEKNIYIYDGRDKTARILADWWDEHQKVDKTRLEKELQVSREKENVASALGKLSAEELESLKNAIKNNTV